MYRVGQPLRSLAAYLFGRRLYCQRSMLLIMQLHAFLLLFAGMTTAAIQTICNRTPYGNLDIAQCVGIVRSFADEQDDALRIFDEEQLQEGPGRSWLGVRNPFKTSVVQIPRLWTECMLKAVPTHLTSDAKSLITIVRRLQYRTYELRFPGQKQLHQHLSGR